MAKRTTQAKGRMTEQVLRTKYPNIVRGSLKFDGRAKKSKITVRCPVTGCGRTRRCYTSDLFQIKHCGRHFADGVSRPKGRLAKQSLAR
jgi:hypothetical protein